MTLPVAAAIILGVTFGQLPGNTLLWNELQNTGHTLLFGPLALVTLCILRTALASTQTRPLSGYLFAIIACLAIGTAIEFVQMLSGRDFSLSDIIRDLCGALIALGIYAAFDPEMAPLWAKQNSILRRTLLILACCLLVTCLYPLASLAYAYQIRQQAFPVIIDFTAHWSRSFLQLQHARIEHHPPEEWKINTGQQSALLTFFPARYPGVNIIEPYPDWSTYNYLSFTLYSTGPNPYDLVLRVHDRLHDQTLSDRFNQQLTLHPGKNHFRIPLQNIKTAPASRNMDMSQINGVIVFASEISAPISFHTSVLRLE